jgi:hypothetical protein
VEHNLSPLNENAGRGFLALNASTDVGNAIFTSSLSNSGSAMSNIASSTADTPPVAHRRINWRKPGHAGQKMATQYSDDARPLTSKLGQRAHAADHGSRHSPATTTELIQSIAVPMETESAGF